MVRYYDKGEIYYSQKMNRKKREQEFQLTWDSYVRHKYIYDYNIKQNKSDRKMVSLAI